MQLIDVTYWAMTIVIYPTVEPQVMFATVEDNVQPARKTFAPSLENANATALPTTPPPP